MRIEIELLCAVFMVVVGLVKTGLEHKGDYYFTVSEDPRETPSFINRVLIFL